MTSWSFSLEMTYLNALLFILLPSSFLGRSEAFFCKLLPAFRLSSFLEKEFGNTSKRCKARVMFRVIKLGHHVIVLPKQVDREFKDKLGGWLWRQTSTILVTWLCFSREKGERMWSHSSAWFNNDVFCKLQKANSNSREIHTWKLKRKHFRLHHCGM